jgi:hypothetical protein
LSAAALARAFASACGFASDASQYPVITTRLAALARALAAAIWATFSASDVISEFSCGKNITYFFPASVCANATATAAQSTATKVKWVFIGLAVSQREPIN